jgi:hypothetical protein
MIDNVLIGVECSLELSQVKRAVANPVLLETNQEILMKLKDTSSAKHKPEKG